MLSLSPNLNTLIPLPTPPPPSSFRFKCWLYVRAYACVCVRRYITDVEPSEESEIAKAIRTEKFAEVRQENQMLKQALASAQIALYGTCGHATPERHTQYSYSTLSIILYYITF